MELKDIFLQTFSFLIFILPIVAPFVLGYFLWNFWIDYVREKFRSEQKYTLLKITPPRDVFKTPAAMELFINSLFQTSGESNWYKKYWLGSVRPWFSLEIVSIEGQVSFYIWTRTGLASYLQGQLYAQYPGIEVEETEDYTSKFDYTTGNYSMFAAEFGLSEPDPVPIKTYVDYGLDKSDTDEEFKVDPLTPTLEFLGSLKQGEAMWFQIIVRAHKKEDKDPNSWFGKVDNWKEDAKKLIIQIRESSVYQPDPDKPAVNLQTKGQNEKIAAIEKSISKLGFDTGLRLIYITEKDSFDPANIGGMMGSFKQFGASNLNNFVPSVVTDFDYKWQDFTGNKLKKLKKNIFEAYVERDYFWKDLPKKPRKHFILNSEELATIYHFPGSVSQTPSVTRVESRKSDAPANLPI